MSTTPALKVNSHSMQPRKGCAQVKDLNADFDSSYWIQSPAYSASSPVYSPTFPAYSDNSSPAWYPTSPADSEDSDITASTSLSRYQYPSYKDSPEYFKGWRGYKYEACTQPEVFSREGWSRQAEAPLWKKLRAGYNRVCTLWSLKYEG